MCPGENWLFAGGAGVEFRVKGVEILAVQVILGDAQRLAEIINLSNGRSALEPQGIQDFFSGQEKVRTRPYFWLFAPHHAAISLINSKGSDLL